MYNLSAVCPFDESDAFYANFANSSLIIDRRSSSMNEFSLTVRRSFSGTSQAIAGGFDNDEYQAKKIAVSIAKTALLFWQ